MRRVSRLSAMCKLALIAPLIAPLMLLVSGAATAAAVPSQGLVLSPLTPELARSVAPGVPATAAGGVVSPHSALAVSGVAVSPYGVAAGGYAPFGDGVGGVVIAWADQRNGNYDCFASKLDGNSNLASGWTAYGNPVSLSDSSQIIVSASTDDAGGAFVLFTDYETSLGAHDLYLQHLTSTGTVAGGYPAVGKTMYTGNLFTATIWPDGSGGLYLMWYPLGQTGVVPAYAGGTAHVERLDASGAPVAGWPVGGLDTGISGNVIILPDGVGGFYVTWMSTPNVYIQRFSSTGVVSGWPPGGLVLYTSAGSLGTYYNPPVMTSLSSGDQLVAWADSSSGRLFAQRVTPAGTAIWTAGGVQVSSSPDSLAIPVAVADGVGGALVKFLDYQGGGPRNYVQRLTSGGAVSGGWPSTGSALSNVNTSQLSASIISDGSDGAIAGWSDARSGNLDNYAQRVTSGGTLAASWAVDGTGICDVAGMQYGPWLVPDGSHGAVAVWYDARVPSYPQIYTARVLADGTVSALASLVDAAAEPGVVRLHWYSPDGSVSHATVERAQGGGEFVVIGEVEADGAGHLRFEDHDVTAGAAYQYRLAVPDGASTGYLGQVTIRVPAAVSFGIEGVRPNPSEGAMSVALALESAAPARLEVLDVAGRRVLAEEVGALGPGEHVLLLEKTARLPAGVYTVRLSQSGRLVMVRAAIVR